MRKIAFHLNNLEQGGSERVVTNLVGRFAAEGYEVIVATEEKAENEFVLDSRVRREIIGLTREDEGKGRFTKFRLREKYLHAFMMKEKPDVLITFAQKADYRALMACRGTNVPVVISIRTDPAGHYDTRIDQLQIHFLFPRAAGAVFQTTQQKEFFKPYCQDQSAIILNPVNPKYVGVPKPEKRDKVVIQHARLVDFKNQPMLIDAFMKVHEKHPDWSLEIWGGDSHDGTREILEEKILSCHAEGFVHLCGPSDELEKIIPKAGVYAFSSDWEGLPNSLIEAMALGMPIVATDCPCGGPAEIIQNGVNGLLVPIKNPDALADGICRLIEDRDLAEKLGEEARKIKDRCGEDIIYRQWKEYLESVCKKAGRN
jgi:glycosyltransferase involved in cell wall biosynthesis